MKTTRWTFIAICGMASVLTMVDVAKAQVRIGIGVGPRGGVVYGGSFGGGYGGGYYGRPYYYGGGPRYYYPGPAIVVAPSVVVPSAPVVVASPEPAVAPLPAPSGGASIRVILPDPNAQVFFDGNPTRQMGTERTFHTPPLAAGAANTYRIRATWAGPGGTLAQEQVIQVSPGQNVVVDFTRPAPASEGLPLPR